MSWFRLQPLSIPSLAQLIMALAILGYLLTIKNRSGPTRILVWMFVGFVGYMFFQFMTDSVVGPAQRLMGRASTGFGVLSILPMMMFAYTFLGNPFEREYRITLPLISIAIIVLCVSIAVDAMGVLPASLAEHIRFAGLVEIALIAIFTVSIFARKALAFKRNGEGEDNRDSQAHRWFAAAFVFIPLTVLPAVARDLGFVPASFAAALSTVYFLLFFFAFVLVFVNHAPEPTTVQVKLVGLSLVTVLLVLSFAGPVANPRSVLMRESEWIVENTPGSDIQTVYREHAHNKSIGSFWMVLVASSLVLILFPVFFRATLLTRLDTLLGGVRRVNDGDLDVSLEAPVHDEIGFLTSSFNGMTASLRKQIREIKDLTEQAARSELERKLLEAENERKTKELEEARKLQLSMLPQEMPDCAGVEIAASMETATEVGGDYYDFVCTPDGSLTAVVGDATGHGMNAGTVVAATKGLYHAMSEESDLTEILKKVSFALKKMNLPGLYMALGIARITDSRVELVGSGLPSALVYRAADTSVEEFALKGAPLGSFLNFPYKTTEFDLGAGDAIVMLTDGFPELFNPDREMLGYERAAEILARYGSRSAQGIVEAFEAEVAEWAGGNRPDDDVTVVALKAHA